MRYTTRYAALHSGLHSVAAEYASMGSRAPAAPARAWAGLRCFLTCPAGPAPLAARGLAAVLARAGPAGAPAAAGEAEPKVVSAVVA